MPAKVTTWSSRQVAALVRSRIEEGGERLWRHEDFAGLPFGAVAKALSRLTKAGLIQRLSKGTYYRSRPTAFGASKPNPIAIQRLAASRKPLFPAGIAAANLLGFTTQTSSRSEVATSAGSLPRKLIGQSTVVHTRRPAAWANLPEADAALLDFLRREGRTSELPPEETIRRTMELLGERGRLDRLLKVADTEPPRVRAILGALAESLGRPPRIVTQLRKSLNPLSKFEFGVFAQLPQARNWQAKGVRP